MSQLQKIFFLLFIFGACSKPQTPPLPPYVTITKPILCDAPIFLQYVGHTEANISVSIKAQVEGLLVGKYFVEGQEVKAGDLLLLIDPRPFQAALDKAEAELAQNLASLRLAQDTAERYSKLLQEEYVSALDYDQFVTNVLTTEAATKQSYADVETARINLDYCQIRAPMDSVTSNLIIEVGNYVPVGGDNPLMSLNQVTPILVSFFVPEKDFPAIQKKQRMGNLKVKLYRSGDPDHPFEGELTLINNAVDENSGSILMRATMANKDKQLWPGEFVDIRVVLEIKENALLLPYAAVQMGQDSQYVFVVKSDHTVELRTVKTGQREDEYIIIEKGIEPDETVVLDGQLNLTSGAQVAIRS